MNRQHRAGNRNRVVHGVPTGLFFLAASCASSSILQDPEGRESEEKPVVQITQYASDRPPPVWEDRRNEIGLGVGATFWNKLPSHEPNRGFPTVQGFGSLQAWGFGLDASYYRRIADFGRTQWWLGGEIGVFSQDERSGFNVTLPSGEIVDDEVFADVGRVTGSTRISLPAGPVFLSLGGGAGFYELSIREESDFFYSLSEEIVEDTAFGGFALASIDLPVSSSWSIRLEDQVHFVRFKDLNRYTPGNDSLSGPINLLQIVFAARF